VLIKACITQVKSLRVFVSLNPECHDLCCVSMYIYIYIVCECFYDFNLTLLAFKVCFCILRLLLLYCFASVEAGGETEYKYYCIVQKAVAAAVLYLTFPHERSNLQHCMKFRLCLNSYS